jgi:hypothetical protein
MVKQRCLGRIAGSVALIGWAITGTASYAQNTVVVPSSLTSVEGSGFTDIPFAPFNFSLMQYIPAESNGRVAGLNVGDRITGLRFRLDNASTPPGFLTGSSDYEIYLSQGQSSPATTRTFSDYYVPGTRQQVRDGALLIPAGSFSSSSSGSVPEAFGPTFEFGTDFTYQGGALVYELRYLAYSERINVDFESQTANSDGIIMLYNSANAGAHLATTAEYRLEDYALVTGFVVAAAVPEPRTMAFVLGAIPIGYGVRRNRNHLSRTVMLR